MEKMEKKEVLLGLYNAQREQLNKRCEKNGKYVWLSGLH